MDVVVKEMEMGKSSHHTEHCLTKKEITFPSGKERTLYGVSSLLEGGKDEATAMISFNKEIAEEVVAYLEEHQVFPSHVQAVIHDLQRTWILPVEREQPCQ